MAHATHHHHQRVELAYMASAYKQPKLFRPGCDEVRHEEIEAVPNYEEKWQLVV